MPVEAVGDLMTLFLWTLSCPIWTVQQLRRRSALSATRRLYLASQGMVSESNATQNRILSHSVSHHLVPIFDRTDPSIPHQHSSSIFLISSSLFLIPTGLPSDIHFFLSCGANLVLLKPLDIRAFGKAMKSVTTKNT